MTFFELDEVRVVRLERAEREVSGTSVAVRQPRIGDVATVVHVLPDGYLAECVSPGGSTCWLTEFAAHELALVKGRQRHDLRPDESALRGNWVVTEALPTADAVCDRIEWLIEHRLERVRAADGGWATLYQDPSDGRLWERVFPQSDGHGGGPPALTHLTPARAMAKYATSEAEGDGLDKAMGERNVP